MVGNTVGALIELGHCDQSDLQVAFGQQAFVGQIQQQTHDVFQGRRAVGKYLNLVQKGSVFIRKPFVDGTNVFRYFTDINIANTCHENLLFVRSPDHFTLGLAVYSGYHSTPTISPRVR